MKKPINIGIIGDIATSHSSLAELINHSPNVVIIENIDDIPRGIKIVFPIKNFENPPIEIIERYAFDEFSRKKKPKNQEWQKRIKNLMKL